MIMSTQSHVVRARALDLADVVVQGIRWRISRIVERVVASRQARAEYEVRSVLNACSAQQLAEYGWSSEDIRRLKS